MSREEKFVGHGPVCGECLEDRWARNRAETEARYQQHLRLGPDLCGCGVCNRSRNESEADA